MRRALLAALVLTGCSRVRTVEPPPIATPELSPLESAVRHYTDSNGDLLALRTVAVDANGCKLYHLRNVTQSYERFWEQCPPDVQPSGPQPR